MKSKPSYIFSADIVRIVAIIGVVLIHTTNAVYTRLDFFGGATWWIAIVLDSLSRISIPLFLLLSGFLLLGKNESLLQSVKRIFSRIAIPFSFWMLFYMWLGTGKPNIHRINLSIFQKVFYGDTYHLYYLVIIFGLYVAAPFIRSFMQTFSKSKNFLMKFLLFLGMAEVFFQYLFQGCLTQNFFTMWVPYTGFFVAGYVLGEKAGVFNKKKLFFGYIVGLVATLALNYLYYFLALRHVSFLISKGCLSYYSDHYVSMNVVLMSLCAFLLLLQIPFTFIKSRTFITNIVHSFARASFGIYLIHPAIGRFLEIQFHLAVDFSTLPLLAIILLKFFLVLVISYGITLLFSFIPGVKLLVGGK